MANRYWVGGSATWDSTAGTKWALTSGGAGGQAVPTSTDDVFLDAASGAVTVTVNTAQSCLSLNCTGFTGTLTGSSQINFYGNLLLVSGMSFTSLGLRPSATSGSWTVTTAGKTVGATAFGLTASTATWTLGDAFTSSSAIQVVQGTFNTNNFAVSGTSFFSSSTNTRAFNIGSSTLTFTGSGTVWNCTTSTNLTLSGTGTISLTSATAKTFAGGGIQTYPTLNQGGAGSLTVTGSNQFANITNTYASTGATSVLFTAGTTNVFTAFNLTGQATRVCTLGSVTAAQATLQKSSTWYMGANSTNGGNNTNLVFTAGGGIDYLSVSYINGTGGTPVSSNGNFLNFF
jgi:hypothetical protein